MNSLELTKKLISIPSYVRGTVDEQKIGLFVYRYLQQIPWLTVTKQPVASGRFNVFAYSSPNIKYLLTGHLDTVLPSSNWSLNPTTPVLRNNRLYGLGSSDMKSGLAAILSSLSPSKPVSNLGLLFYVDEEYDFAGMKQFIAEYKGKLKPKIIASADGDGLAFDTGCRGLIEITFTIKGQTGHAARPSSGINAIDAATKAVSYLKSKLPTYTSPQLGQTSCNLAYLGGGQKLTNSSRPELGREGNIIPDYAEFVLDLRPASEKLTAATVINLIKRGLRDTKANLVNATIRHDLGAWITPRTALTTITNLVKNTRFVSAANSGYTDVQMFYQNFGRVPCFIFGPGEPGVSHQPNEYVKVSSLKQATAFYKNLLNYLATI